MRTKKEIVKNHKEESEVLVTTAEVIEVDGLRKTPEFDIEFMRDKRGWYERLIMKASASKGSVWTSQNKGTERLRIESFDMDLKITLAKTANRKEQVIEMSFCDLCDIVTGFMVMNEFYKKRTGRDMYTPEEIRKIVTKTIKRSKGKK
jgi:hypothetical protein